ncbi:MAG: putative 2-phosphosulfolactate phosphatase [Firmicutes bacterium ADurb.Bin182]|nr:MAG: putative 2-phosphosulfolactate phosphatase [Firmicutes bacterium ADurb.Bin182]
MRVEVHFAYDKIADSIFNGSVVIMVDVLRASTSIITAIKNGAEKIIPAGDPGEAASFAAKLGFRDCLLAGERGGLKLPGFDLGNSPLEYTQEKVKGRTIILSTTNGTNAINKARAARFLLIGGLVNRTAAAKTAIEKGCDVLILCAGTDGQFSADDVLTAGALIDAISAVDPHLETNDLGLVSCMVYSNWLEGKADISLTHHYSRLIKLGFEKDVAFCFSVDSTDVVPRYSEGVIVR